MAPHIKYEVPSLEEWLRPKYHIPIHRDAATFDSESDTRPAAFETTTCLGFEDIPYGESLWHYGHVLGRGGFGFVGLWQKRDESNNIIDEMAVKETIMPTSNTFRLGRLRSKVPEEAIIQTSLQSKCTSVLQLRGIAHLAPPSGHRAKLRYYLEYCPNGDLHGVLQEYHRRMLDTPDTAESIPEAFLWQLLYKFAQVMIAMESGDFDHPHMRQFRGHDPYILHLDIKLENVMLNNPEDEDPVKGYPAPKVGDWGLARLTSFDHAKNSASWRDTGTRHWFPPEQWKSGSFGSTWSEPPPWRTDRVKNNHPYSTAHSVFAFASVVWRLMILDLDRMSVDKYIEDASQREADTHRQNFRIISESLMDHNVFMKPTNYTSLLKETIANCLNFNPAARPKATHLRDTALNNCFYHALLHRRNSHNANLHVRPPDPNSDGYSW